MRRTKEFDSGRNRQQHPTAARQTCLHQQPRRAIRAARPTPPEVLRRFLEPSCRWRIKIPCLRRGSGAIWIALRALRCNRICYIVLVGTSTRRWSAGRIAGRVIQCPRKPDSRRRNIAKQDQAREHRGAVTTHNRGLTNMAAPIGPSRYPRRSRAPAGGAPPFFTAQALGRELPFFASGGVQAPSG
jgi:hypothetical protein